MHSARGRFSMTASVYRPPYSPSTVQGIGSREVTRSCRVFTETTSSGSSSPVSSLLMTLVS